MRTTSVRAAAACALWTLTAGCATTGTRPNEGGRSGGARVAPNQFPSRAELSRLATAAPAQPRAEQRVAAIERWELTGPLPTEMGGRVSTETTPFASLLRERAERTGGRAVLTEAMQCVARELGVYALHHEDSPPEPLVDFIATRCGALTPRIAFNLAGGTSDPHASEADMVTRYRSELLQSADRLMAEGMLNVGGWVGRDGARFVVMSVAEQRMALIEPRSFAPDAQGNLVVEGRLLETAQGLRASVNHGRWATSECTRDMSVRLPSFRVRCHLDATDTATRLALDVFPPQRLLGHTVFSALVGAQRDAARVFDVTADDPSHHASDASQARDVLLTMLNEVRRDARLSPVTLASRETDTACQLTPAFFSGLEETGATASDRIALGMMAGWDVDGAMIRQGHFFTSRGAREDDLMRWLSWGLEWPTGRAVLLDPAVRQVALCPWFLDGHVEGVMWSSYSFYDDASLSDEESQVYARLDDARRAHGKENATRLTDLRPMMESRAAALRSNGGDFDATLESMLSGAVEARQAGVRGWVIPTIDLASIEFPSELTDADSLRASVYVTHWRNADAAWGQMVAFILMESR